jgi:hypothetical protein
LPGKLSSEAVNDKSFVVCITGRTRRPLVEAISNSLS